MTDRHHEHAALCERLEAMPWCQCAGSIDDLDRPNDTSEAARVIDEQAAEIERLREALERVIGHLECVCLDPEHFAMRNRMRATGRQKDEADAPSKERICSYCNGSVELAACPGAAPAWYEYWGTVFCGQKKKDEADGG